MIFPMEQIPQEIGPFSEWLRALRPIHVMEIGVRRGGTSALWHTLSAGLVIGVDWTLKDSLGAAETERIASELMRDYPRFRFINGDSHSYLTLHKVQQLLDGSLLDFLFIDGDHSYTGALQDWTMYKPLVRSGGVVAFHDIVDTKFMRSCGHGVYRLWEEIQGEKREWCVRADWGGIGAVIV